MVISLIRKHLWMFGLLWALTSTFVFAQSNEAIPPVSQLQVLPPKIVSPTLESLERPADHYQLDEIVEYRIKVKWPEEVTGIRMNSPQMVLENLELIGIGEEAVSGMIEEILTLRFKGLHSGPAKISSLTLEWIQADGISTSRLNVPPVELTIKKPANPLLWIGIASGTLVTFGVGFLVFRLKKKTAEVVQIPESLEESYLRQLDALKNSISGNSNSKVLLNDLMKVLERYVQQKFDWNHSQEDYNALHKKADQAWGSKEVKEIQNLFEKIEYSRFSGSELKQEELISLFQSVRSFIERKKVI